MATEKEILNLVNTYKQKIKGLNNLKYTVFMIKDLRNDSNLWSDWTANPGIYYISRSDKIEYVGRALPGSGLGSRIKSEINSLEQADWKDVVTDPNAKVGIFEFPLDNWYWVATFEVMLIDKIGKDNLFNKRSA